MDLGPNPAAVAAASIETVEQIRSSANVMTQFGGLTSDTSDVEMSALLHEIVAEETVMTSVTIEGGAIEAEKAPGVEIILHASCGHEYIQD